MIHTSFLVAREIIIQNTMVISNREDGDIQIAPGHQESMSSNPCLEY